MLGIFCLFSVMLILLREAHRAKQLWTRWGLIASTTVMLALLIYTTWGADWRMWLLLAIPIASVIAFAGYILVAAGKRKHDMPRKFSGSRSFRFDDET